MYYYSDEDLNLMKHILEFERFGLYKQEISNRLVHNTSSNEVIVQTKFKIDSTNKKSIDPNSNTEKNNFTTSKELYNLIGFKSLSYSDWIKKNILDNPFAIEDVAFTKIPAENTGESSSDSIKDFKITSDFSKKLLRAAELEKNNTKSFLESIIETLDMIKLCVMEKYLSISNGRPKNDNGASI